EKQLQTSANASAMEQIASALANAARAQADVNARNELGIAQIKAAALVSTADTNLANAIAQGRQSEILNAQAQSKLLHQLADFLTGTLAEQNIANAKAIADDQANRIHGPSLAEEQNGLALAANDVL